jgi:hypothetical protein
LIDMGFNLASEVNRAPHRVVTALAGFAVALTMIRLSAARFDSARTEADTRARRA